VILSTLSWSDRLVLPAGYTMPSGSSLDSEMSLVVLWDKPTEAVDVKPVGQVVLPDGNRVPLQHFEWLGEPNGPHVAPGLSRMLREASPVLLIAGLFAFLMTLPLQAARWFLLMRYRGIGAGYLRSLRLTLVGAFFNLCMPGSTGGDVMKAYYATRGRGRKADAVMSVVVDRIAGMLGLMLLAGLAGLVMLGNPTTRAMTLWAWVGLVVVLVAGLLYSSKMLRNLIAVKSGGRKLPGAGVLGSIDAAAVAYRHHKLVVFGAVLLSLPVHLGIVGAITLAGLGLGIGHSAGLMISTLPAVVFAGAMPVSIQGLGVMGGTAIVLLESPGLATANQLVGMLGMLRLYMAVIAIIGAVVIVSGDIRLHPQDNATAASPADSTAPADQSAADQDQPASNDASHQAVA